MQNALLRAFSFLDRSTGTVLGIAGAALSNLWTAAVLPRGRLRPNACQSIRSALASARTATCLPLWKMSFADAVIVSLDGRVFVRSQHSIDFRMTRELEEIVVAPGIAAERLLGPLQQFHLAMDGEHLLNKCPAKV